MLCLVYTVLEEERLRDDGFKKGHQSWEIFSGLYNLTYHIFTHIFVEVFTNHQF